MTREGKTWTSDEKLYLEEKWGKISMPAIANNLGRSVEAIKIKAQKLGLGSFILSGDYITFNQFLLSFNGTPYNSYKLISWVKNRGFPIHTKRVNNCSFRVIYIDEFWEWAEKNRSFIDFSRLEPFTFGIEPEWVAEQRKNDYRSFSLQRKDPWSKAEDEHLLYLLKKQKYGYKEISDILKRSEGAIQRRCRDLGTPYRPVKADNHGASAEWKDRDYEILTEGIKSGKSYKILSDEISKSEKAIRGKVYFEYFTENLDKVRQMLGDGNFGDNVPVPLVKQAIYNSHYRTDTKQELSIFAGILKYRMNKLGYDPYFQRFMCMNWDDFEGCKACGTDCDSCTDFRRIKEQYCARCGETFFERAENRFCKDCRKARKKSAQRKYAILHRKN